MGAHPLPSVSLEELARGINLLMIEHRVKPVPLGASDWEHRVFEFVKMLSDTKHAHENRLNITQPFDFPKPTLHDVAPEVLKKLGKK